MDSRQRRNIISAVIVAAVVLMAVLATWVSLRTGEQPASGRPDRPLDTPVVRAPPIDAPNTAIVGGPPAPSASNAPAR